MEITIPRSAQAAAIFSEVKNAPPGSTINCYTDKQYSIAKIALVKLQRTSLTLQHIDAAGYAIKQATSREREDIACADDELSSDQIRAIRALERALKQCARHGVVVVGFSDSLVGVPAVLGHDMSAISSAAAFELDTFDAYKGIDAEDDF